MGPGFRYHLVTLVAVFLALGLGMVIGMSYVQGPVLERLTRHQEQLNVTFTNEIAPLREQVARYHSFVTAVTPTLVSERLAGKRVALVQTGDYANAATLVREALEAAGATVMRTTVVEPTYAAAVQLRAAELVPKLQAAHPSLPDGPDAVSRILAVSAARGGPRSDLEALRDARLARTDGDYTRRADLVILVGGATNEDRERVQAVDLPLIRHLRELGARTLFVEPMAAAFSYIGAIAGQGIATVDNVDTDIGRIAVVLAADAEPGDYGAKPTASAGLLPRATPTQ